MLTYDLPHGLDKPAKCISRYVSACKKHKYDSADMQNLDLCLYAVKFMVSLHWDMSVVGHD